MERCVQCGEPALQGVSSDIGPLCAVHVYRHMGVPTNEAQEDAACRFLP